MIEQELRSLATHIKDMDSGSPEAAMMLRAAYEIEHLRAALQRIADEVASDDDMTDWNSGDIAREALKSHTSR